MVTKTGIFHAVYWDPRSPVLTPFINYKKQFPDVPVMLVFNPFGGAGTARVDWYADIILQCKRAGIKVYGYVYTQWDARDINVVYNEMQRYKCWYCMDGIMFDELSNSTNPPTYVSNLDDYAKNTIDTKFGGAMETNGNPGTTIASNYVGLLDSYSVRERDGYEDLSWIASTYSGVAKSNFSAIFYNVASITNEQIETMADYVGWLLVTERTFAENPFNDITAHLEQLFTVLDGVPAS